MEKENIMGTMDMKKLVLVNGLPLMLSLLISNLYNFVDSIFVSYVSDSALTALSLASPIQILMSALGIANATGLNAVISRALGERDDKKVKETATSSITLAFYMWVLLAILGLVMVKPYFISQSGGDAKIAEYGIEYLSIVMIGSLGFMCQWVFDRFTMSSGKSKLFIITLSSGAITNIILDPILIFGYFGLPAMGVKGAAIATIIGQFVGAFMGIIINRKYNKEIPFSFSLVPNFKRTGEILKIGLPSGIAQGMLSAMGVYVNYILISFSSATVAVYGICVKIQSLALVPIWGFNNGLVPLVAYNYGANRLDRSYNSIRLTILYEYIFFTFVFVILEVFPSLVFSLFKVTDKMLEIGLPAIRLLTLSYLLSIVCLALASGFQGFGRGMESMVLTLLRQTIVLFIFLTILKTFNNETLIWAAYPLSELTCMPIGILMYKHIKKQVEEENTK